MDEVRLKPYKKDFECSYTLGVFPTLELIACKPDTVERIILSPKAAQNEGVGKMITFAEKSGIPALFEPKTLARISSKDNCFAAGVFRKYTCKLRKHTNHLVLVNPSDMGNLGTILRTATAFGVEDIAIISPGADIYDPKVVRASMGAIFRVNFQYFNSFAEYLQAEGRGKRMLIPFMLDGAPIYKVASDYRAQKQQEQKDALPFSLIFGNESAGLPVEFLSIGTPARIIHGNTVDSLNLPMAVGIGLYTFTEMNQEVR